MKQRDPAAPQGGAASPGKAPDTGEKGQAPAPANLPDAPALPGPAAAPPSAESLPDALPAAAPASATATPADPLADLAEREAALAVRERRFEAREHVLALGLNPQILEHFDYSSPDALAASLRVATLAAQSQPPAAAPAVPAAARPLAPQFATYLERARLFETDPAAYREMVNQSRE